MKAKTIINALLEAKKQENKIRFIAKIMADAGKSTATSVMENADRRARQAAKFEARLLDMADRPRQLSSPAWESTPPTEPGRYAWCRTPNTQTRIFYAAFDADDGVLRVDHPTIPTCTISVAARDVAGWWLKLD